MTKWIYNLAEPFWNLYFLILSLCMISFVIGQIFGQTGIKMDPTLVSTIATCVAAFSSCIAAFATCFLVIYARKGLSEWKNEHNFKKLNKFSDLYIELIGQCYFMCFEYEKLQGYQTLDLEVKTNFNRAFTNIQIYTNKTKYMHPELELTALFNLIESDIYPVSRNLEQAFSEKDSNEFHKNKTEIMKLLDKKNQKIAKAILENKPN